MTEMKSLKDCLETQVPLGTAQELVEMYLPLQILRKLAASGKLDAELSSTIRMVVNTAELFFHDIIVMREMLGLDMMYNSDKLNAMNDKICHSAGKVLQSQDFRDTNTEIQTTDFGISKKKENN